ncbi:MAG TPA: NADH-quinone oxidoreductase subunit NuoF [Bacilli bacterium]|nr:NADH-quinone oxidoreductase subunit NuoF [Bacilli bacterium]HPA98744.1 NADH-quinone oxidoreductase subunit NuoF [Bacilli bacterium]HPV55016.1 NADH-quinone oxidoreductase subunit NuoF [Bacilli bacterium]HQO93442.1 NADH-quinone oxidoreductase subunit NuoF [Bacilli bacterium]HQQ38810.1 NADH-quinone oxidoreductase subunit NuoF [Bacilli bacterium]
MASCGLAASADVIYDAIEKAINENELKGITLTSVGCIGECALEPIVEVYDKNNNRYTYCMVNEKKAKEIVEKHLIGGEVLSRYLIENFKKVTDEEGKVIEVPNYQYRIALKNCGIINPLEIDQYIGLDGYKALEKVLFEMSPEEVVDVVTKSGLRGRGGGGFPTGLKWKFTAANKGGQSFVICNADEGDPGAFMDRAVLEGDPHAVIEAMIICGYAISATQGYVYIRAEYPLAVERLQYAIDKAYEYGILGKGVLGSKFDFDLEIRLGAGAFVCGEETALIASIEGERGMPRNKPPYPASQGLWGRPTVINNVETFANVAQIILKGADWFKAIGTEKAAGTKVFALGGKIKNTGLLEVPMGTTLREVVYDVGGGLPKGKAFKAVQTGGPSGGILTKDDLDTPIDYDNLVRKGSMMGSGGMIVMDQDNCMVDIAKFYLEFTVEESCGKCTPCRDGNLRMLEILNKITDGKATMKDLDDLRELALMIKDTSLCALGQSAPNPVLSTLDKFYDEYLEHVVNKRCPAGVCKNITKLLITDECIGCGKCLRNCPVNAISGDVKKKHYIDLELCVNCGTCKPACPVNAIVSL